MCYECWKGHGYPAIDTPAVRQAAALVGELYETCCTGGALHVFTDDWNISDGDLQHCVEYLNVVQARFTDEELRIQRELIALFTPMSVAERASALALDDKFWP